MARQELAERLGIRPNYLSRILCGRSAPSRGLAARIALVTNGEVRLRVGVWESVALPAPVPYTFRPAWRLSRTPPRNGRATYGPEIAAELRLLVTAIRRRADRLERLLGRTSSPTERRVDDLLGELDLVASAARQWCDVLNG